MQHACATLSSYWSRAQIHRSRGRPPSQLRPLGRRYPMKSGSRASAKRQKRVGNVGIRCVAYILEVNIIGKIYNANRFDRPRWAWFWALIDGNIHSDRLGHLAISSSSCRRMTSMTFASCKRRHVKNCLTRNHLPTNTRACDRQKTHIAFY